MDGAHDLGGMHGFGPVNTPGADVAYAEAWEPRAQFVGLMSKASGGTMRRHIEALPPAEYLASSYYVRWLAAAENLHVQAGAVTAHELRRWYEHFEADPAATVPRRDDPGLRARVERRLSSGRPLAAPDAPLFAPGARVTVRRSYTAAHHRCPRYVRGAPGTVAFVAGEDRVPGDDPSAAAVAPVYTVRFSSLDLWGPTDEPPFTVLVDLWESYLEAAP